jgi:hypothetical protein
MTTRPWLALCAIACVLPACSGSSTTPGPSLRGPTPSPQPSATPTASAKPSATPTGSAKPSASPTATASASASPKPSPTALPSSNIIVANLDRPSITTYAQNPLGNLNEAPVATIAGSNTQLVDPEGLTVDASGRIYVVANNGSSGSITVYAANPSGTLNEAPIATITGSNTGLNDPAGVALDASGRIYVSNDGGTPSITVYAASPSGTMNEAPLATIAGTNTFLSDPIGLSVDGSGNIYVANEAGSILVYPAIPTLGGSLNEMPTAVISGPTSGLRTPYDVVLDATGKLYVVDSTGGSGGIGAIDVFAANPSGFIDPSPLASITGSSTGLNGPGFLCLDAGGKIYVTDASAQSIFVYAANPSGTLNEAPLATISGNNTGLLAPYGIYVH